ncbi:MAG: type II toxin-antitoxin system Phd/YefM family antitoxin [Candidatus Nomurabacteria bacterium]|jgi:PHD/YefM family antitoxin component YafN of YafNO toxin-antitoxin module|nr:type II toxin-antitoxin system Phd/YefM family antitoxin [Candidatus Nomurabacteria bacterium]
MPTIIPISDLRDYNKVVKMIGPDDPVYLTKNGRDKYVIVDAVEYNRWKAREQIFALLKESEDSIARGEKTWTVAEAKKAYGIK